MFLKRKRPPDKRFSESAEPVLLIIFVMRGRSGGGSAPYFFCAKTIIVLPKSQIKQLYQGTFPLFLGRFA